ncbi:hypothetical protein M0654_22080 [Rhizobium sp. NTR19]|uniref:Uncharacterized protein n=1 Tax=Neorhizobium turbinariae TaxID=2937795 RepID=A0ABT0IXP4_9HYPH|nr:hypothetical protein [Neorhizobium turbinariae]MCK8782662.1 hypothetical protein [Neorhizobium turbinariae]
MTTDALTYSPVDAPKSLGEDVLMVNSGPFTIIAPTIAQRTYLEEW